MSSRLFENPEQLRETLFALIEGLPYGILLVNGHHEVQAMNSRAGKMLHLVGRSVQGWNCWELLRFSLGVTALDVQQLQRSDGRLTLRAKAADGSELIMALARNDLASPFAHIGGFFLTIQDITHWTLLGTQVERQRRLAAMGELAEVLSEQLKNPLGSIELCASMLVRELAGDPENVPLARQIEQAVRSMDFSLHNYLTYASLPTPQPALLSMAEWLCRSREKLTLLDTEGRYRLVTTIDDEQLRVTADADMLQLLALNAGRNAMESMPQGGEVRIEVRRVRASDPGIAYCEIRCSDQGNGIPAAMLDRVFDPGYTTKKQATGMGLALIHYIVEAHHGLVRLESVEEQGTTLVVLLPLAPLREVEGQ